MPNDKLEWKAYEYFFMEKSSDWFWSVGVVALTAIIIASIFGDFLFAIVIAVSTFTLLVYAMRRPKLIPLLINREGISVNKVFYSYSFLTSFWVDKSDPQLPKILIKSKKILMPLIVVPIEEIDPDTVREFILNYMQEEELAEPVTQKIMEYLGF